GEGGWGGADWSQVIKIIGFAADGSEWRRRCADCRQFISLVGFATDVVDIRCCSHKLYCACCFDDRDARAAARAPRAVGKLLAKASSPWTRPRFPAASGRDESSKLQKTGYRPDSMRRRTFRSFRQGLRRKPTIKIGR